MFEQLNFLQEDFEKCRLQRIRKAILRLQEFEPAEGYYLSFSGGKDSLVIKTLADMAGVKYDAHYNMTTVDPPELIYFIKKNHPDVIIEKSETTMWRLIEKKLLPPTRLMRYCCDHLKERGGDGRFVITGVRWAESDRRKNSREIIEFDIYGSSSKKAIRRREKFRLLNDNDEKRRMIEHCTIKGKHIINPIIDWSDSDIWTFIKENNIPYCKLYDQGWKRIGCIACPLNSSTMKKELEAYPKFKKAYLRAFDRMLKERKRKGKETSWRTAEEVMEWWTCQ